MKKKDIFIIGLIAVVFLIVGIATLDDYSLHWDSTYHFTVADYYSETVLSGRSINLEEIPLTEKFNPLQINNSGWEDNHYYSPLSDIMGGFTYIYFSKPLGFDYISGHHLHLIVFATMVLVVLYVFILQAFGQIHAIISVLILSLYPRFIGHAHTAVKDIPILFFTVLMFYLIWKGIIHEQKKYLLLGSLLLGILISLKLSNLSFGLIILIWFVLINIKKFKLKEGLLYIPFKIVYLFSIMFVGLGYVIVQPSFLLNSIGIKKYLFNTVKFWFGTKTVKVFYFGQNYVSTVVPRSYSVVSFLIVTPLPYLFFGVIGLYVCLKNTIVKRDKTMLLVILWFTLPIVKFFLPEVPNYQLIRLFLESLPPFAIIVSFGMIETYKSMSKQSKNKQRMQFGGLIFAIVIFLWLLLSIISIHPYEGAYFNEAVGTLGDAQRNFDTDYGANSVREGMELVNAEVEKGATVVMPIGGKLGAYYVRSDIDFIRGGNSFGEYDYTEELFDEYDRPFYVVYPVQESLVYHLLNDYKRSEETIVYYVENELEPIETVEKDGAVLFKIYKVEQDYSA